MRFIIVSAITNAETIAAGRAIRKLSLLRTRYGHRHWRKMKGVATIQLANGDFRRAELHWYEAHGIGKKEIKWKRYLDER